MGAALAWVQSEIARYGGDPDQATLVGHSSGAHIAMLHCVRAARPLVSGFVGLAGVYNIASHYQWESQRGVEEVGTKPDP